MAIKNPLQKILQEQQRKQQKNALKKWIQPWRKLPFSLPFSLVEIRRVALLGPEESQNNFELSVDDLKKTEYVSFDYEKYCNSKERPDEVEFDKYKKNLMTRRFNGTENTKRVSLSSKTNDIGLSRKTRMLKKTLKECSIRMTNLSLDDVLTYQITKESQEFIANLKLKLSKDQAKIESSRLNSESIITDSSTHLENKQVEKECDVILISDDDDYEILTFDINKTPVSKSPNTSDNNSSDIIKLKKENTIFELESSNIQILSNLSLTNQSLTIAQPLAQSTDQLNILTDALIPIYQIEEGQINLNKPSGVVARINLDQGFTLNTLKFASAESEATLTRQRPIEWMSENDEQLFVNSNGYQISEQRENVRQTKKNWYSNSILNNTCAAPNRLFQRFDSKKNEPQKKSNYSKLANIVRKAPFLYEKQSNVSRQKNCKFISNFTAKNNSAPDQYLNFINKCKLMQNSNRTNSRRLNESRMIKDSTITTNPRNSQNDTQIEVIDLTI